MYHLRLGWLDVMAGFVRSESGALSDVERGLKDTVLDFDAWIEQAGLTSAPRGAPGLSHMRDLVRMLVWYGLYDENAKAFTDAGRVWLATPRQPSSPFQWSGARRWVGLWLLVRADGDVVLQLLRNWPDSGLLDKAADSFVSQTLFALGRKTRDSQERAGLEQQARRVSTPSGRSYIVWPRLEPLRELGYLRRETTSPRATGYALTETGSRLRDVLNTAFANDTADELLKQGLSRCFLLAESRQHPSPATFDDLIEGLSASPESLHVTSGEVPLSPFVTWLQWSLFKHTEPKWVDDALAASLARDNQQDPRGSFALKRAQRVDELNLAWTPRESATVLENASADRNDSSNVSVEPPDPPAAPADPARDPSSLFLHCQSEAPALMWLQYVSSRSAPLHFGDSEVLRRGGATTRLRQLDALLQLPSKYLQRKKQLPVDELPLLALPATSCLQRYATKVGAQLHLKALLEEWSANGAAVDTVRARIRFAKDEVTRSRVVLRHRIKTFLETRLNIPVQPKEVIKVFNEDWPVVRELTRALLADLVADGTWASSTIEEKIAQVVSDSSSPVDAALHLLDAMFASPQSHDYRESRQASVDWVEAVSVAGFFAATADQEAVALEKIPGDDGIVRLSVTGVLASSSTHARRIGSQRCDEAVAQATWCVRPHKAPARLEEGRVITVEDAEEERATAPVEFFLWGRLVIAPSTPRQRERGHLIADAERSLARLSIVERRASEVLLTGWTIIEDLARAGRDIPSHKVIARLARAVAVGLFRRRLMTVHDEAAGSLIALVHLQPESPELDSLVEQWIPTWLRYAAVKDAHANFRLAGLLRGSETWQRGSDYEAFNRLWDASARGDSTPCACELLQRAITFHAPLPARHLADVWKMLDVSPDKTLRDAKALSDAFGDLLDSSRAFLSEVYDARNRIVHQGELARLHGRDAPIHLEALVPTLLAVIELLMDELMRTDEADLDSAWARLHVASEDLARSDRLKGARCEDVAALVGLSGCSS